MTEKEAAEYAALLERAKAQGWGVRGEMTPNTPKTELTLSAGAELCTPVDRVTQAPGNPS